jgi:hypothetical protein
MHGAALLDLLRASGETEGSNVPPTFTAARDDAGRPVRPRRSPNSANKEPAMPSPMAAPDVLNRDYLEIRCKLLEIAASLDRIDRSQGSAAGDPRLALIREAFDVLMDERGDRAEQIQLLFSRQYDDDWQQAFGMPPSA